MVDLKRSALLHFARGGSLSGRSYLVYYEVDESGKVIIHSCGRLFASEDTLIRFCNYEGNHDEIEVSDSAVMAAARKYLAKNVDV
jgi:hypothetical protein